MRETTSRVTRADVLVLGLIAAWGIGVLGPQLSHPFFPLWDEAMHQAAARGTLDTPFYPHIYADALTPYNPHHYWASQVWLNKPPGPFWFAAAVMKVIGVTPLALRLASLLGMIAAASVAYLLARAAAGRFFAALFALVLLSLPFTWIQTQGLLFGDVTDCTLVGCNALAVFCLVRCAERKSWRWAIAAGAMTGLGILCKVVLALTPLGVAVGLFLVGLARLAPGLKWWAVLITFAIAAVVAVPWNVYAAQTWPEPYWLHARTWLGHLAPFAGATIELGGWKRPLDGVINEINANTMSPFPAGVTLLAAVWMLVRSVRLRDTTLIALSGWLWSTWVVISFSDNKVPAAVWGCVPAAIAALALLFRDAIRWPALGIGAAAALFAPAAIKAFGFLSKLRWAMTMPKFEQTLYNPGLFEQLFLIVCGLAVGSLLTKLLKWRLATAITLTLPGLIALGVLVVNTRAERLKSEADHAARLWVTHAQEVGLAVDPVIPKKSVLFQDIDRDPSSSETQMLMFYSGRMAYLGLALVPTARARGYHPYLISPASEAFAPVPGVPLHAAMRAYDLDVPGPPAALPQGLIRVLARVGSLTVLGAAAGPSGAGKDRWAFYVKGNPTDFSVVFQTHDGEVTVNVPAAANLRNPPRLAGAEWFILPALGPKRADVKALKFGDQVVALD